MRIGRRTLIGGGAALTVLVASRAGAQANAPFDEQQRGDPDVNYETVHVNPDAVAGLSSGAMRATFNPRNPSFSQSLLTVAQRFVGMSRANNRDQVIKFLDLFDLPFENPNGDVVPYCASGLAYAAALAYYEFWNPGQSTQDVIAVRGALPELEHYHFYPSPSVVDMYYTARGMRRWRDASDSANKPTPRPGWIVIYSFGHEADHCGIVESSTANELSTIELNTTNGLAGSQRNGGMVARRQRAYSSSVKGFIDVNL